MIGIPRWFILPVSHVIAWWKGPTAVIKPYVVRTQDFANGMALDGWNEWHCMYGIWDALGFVTIIRVCVLSFCAGETVHGAPLLQHSAHPQRVGVHAAMQYHRGRQAHHRGLPRRTEAQTVE